MKAIRTILPEATLFTNIIVSSTDESGFQLQDTCSAMREFGFNMAYLAPYSPRPDAASFRWQDSVSPAKKNRFFHELTEVLKEVPLEYNCTRLNRKIKVFVERYDRRGAA